MADGILKVLGRWASPYAIRVRLALNLKGLEYEYVEELDLHNKSELLLKSNPVYKKVPVLIHDGKPISESAIIVQYIDEFWTSSGPTILPSDPHDRATARFWTSYMDDKWFPSLLALFKAKTEEEEAEATEKVFDGLPLIEEAFEKCSKGKRFFGEDNIGYLDITFGCYLGWIEAAKELKGVEVLDPAKTPHLVSWAKRFRSEDAVIKEMLLQTDKFVEYGKKLGWKNLAAAN